MKQSDATIHCPNCGTPILLNHCSKDWCPNCGQRFCCTDNACLDKIDDDLWAAHQELLLRQAHSIFEEQDKDERRRL
ncbi:MAG: hypothetical protein KF726_21660 [Anaerolineae bacterium]|nr:hypothetical protein [Anaerolineae bacterium]